MFAAVAGALLVVTAAMTAVVTVTLPMQTDSAATG